MNDVVDWQTQEITITMTAQFSGSRSAGDRRRRRLVVNGDGTALESTMPDGDAAEMESELIESEAAGPWVPASEFRIWVYAIVIGVGLSLLSVALLYPSAFHQQLAPLTNHLLKGYRPVLVVGAQTAFLVLSAQMTLLISWYRSRCRLDFGGRYRIWPWAAGLLGLAAFCSATETHHAIAAVVSKSEWLVWRGSTVSWLLPFCVAALPMTLWVDRDMRNGRSGLITFRVSALLGVVWAWFEICHPDLKSQTWFEVAYLLVPMFASATLFISLWHHARVVAYVCPDPPELDEQSAWSLLLQVVTSIGSWTLSLGRWLLSLLPSRKAAAEEDDKPKRRRKKAEPEAAPAKRKRRTPTKRATPASRTRPKPAEVEEAEEEEVDTSAENIEEEMEVESPADAESQEQTWESWEEEQTESKKPSNSGSAAKSKGNGRNLYVDEGHGSSVPAPKSRRQQQNWDQESSDDDEQASSSNGDQDEDSYDEQSGGSSGDQMKGLSKRQRREMKRQIRDQDRGRGR